VQNFSSRGPVIAVGRPDDLLFHIPLVRVGASRKYVKSDK
jgi:hypothetical protein